MIKKIISSSIITVLILFYSVFSFPGTSFGDVLVEQASVVISNITDSSASAKVTITIYSGIDNDTTFTLEYSTNESFIPGRGTPVTINPSSGVANISGLSSGTTYYYHVIHADNSTLIDSSAGSFKTTGLADTVSINLSNVSTSTAVLNIKISRPDLNHTTTLCKPIPNPLPHGANTDCSFAFTLNKITVDSNNFIYNFSGLDPKTKYDYAFFPNGGGLDLVSVKFTTLTATSTNPTSSSTVPIPVVSNITTKSAKITLSFNSSNMPIAGNEPMVFYDSTLVANGFYGKSSLLQESSPTEYSIVLSDLVPNTKYYFSVFDNTGSTPYGTINQTFTTTGLGTAFDSSAITISNFSANTNTNGSVITFSATASGVPATTDFNYSFACGLSSTAIGDLVSNLTVAKGSIKSPLSLSDSLSILPPHAFVASNIPYYCQILDANGHTLSNIATVTIASGQPDIPYVSSVTDSQATIKVNLSQVTMTPPYIMYGDSPTNLTSAQIPMSALDGKSYVGDITGLKSDTIYYYQVYNNSSYIAQPYADATSFRTTQKAVPTVQLITGSIKPFNANKYSGGLVTCGTGQVIEDPNNPGRKIISDYCNFQSLMAMINKFIGIMVFIIAPAIAAIAMAWGGFLYMTSGGGEGKSQAKSLLIDALVGWLLAFASWIIIKFIMVQLGYADGWMHFW
ncbi:MAG: hypothetical protein WCO65_02745 [bacterium]